MSASAYSSIELENAPCRKAGERVMTGINSSAAILAARSLSSLSPMLPRCSENIACLDSF